MKTSFNIDFVGKFVPASILSFLLVGGSLVLFFVKGLNYGVDFRGGVEIQVKFSKKVELGELRTLMKDKGVPLSQLQSIGTEGSNEFLLKLESDQGDLNAVATKVSSALGEKYGADSFEILKTDIVGPKAGAELRNSAFKALFWSVLAIMIYLALRFEYKYAPGAIVALIHDSVIVIGAFILTQKEFTLQIVAALLAIIGYSVNDTVVIYDRVREIENQTAGTSTIGQMINRAINETMSRTLATTGTTLAVSAIMLIWGGSVIHDFFFAMTFGILIGTYSSVFIAVPMTIFFEKVFSKKAA